MNTPAMEMPRYQSHKRVHALKIQDITFHADFSATITPADEGYAPFCVPSTYVAKHDPKAGGYYVVYSPDGYASWSPADAFEDGYTRLP